MPEKKRILYILSELDSLLSISESAELAKELIFNNIEAENEARVIIPRFHTISERKNSIHSVQRLSGINVRVGNQSISLIVKVGSVKKNKHKAQVYFIEHEDLFKEKEIYKEKEGAIFPNREERLIFSCKSALTIVKHLMWPPDIIHTFGWPWALLPMYGKLDYQESGLFKNTKFVHTHDQPIYTEPFTNALIDMAQTTYIDREKLNPLSTGTPDGFVQLASQYADATTHSFDLSEHPLAKQITDSNSQYIPNDEELPAQYMALYDNLDEEKEATST